MPANNPVRHADRRIQNQADHGKGARRPPSRIPFAAEVIRGQCLADACIGVTHTDRSRAQCASGRWTSTPGRITSPSGSAALTAPVNPDNAPAPTYKAARCCNRSVDASIRSRGSPARRTSVETLSSDAGVEGFDERNCPPPSPKYGHLISEGR